MGLRWASVGIAVLFALFLLAFEILPGTLLPKSLLADPTAFAEATKPLYLRALNNSFQLALLSAFEGAILGTLTAWALWASSNQAIKRFVTGLCGVAANFAGPPLAFAFIIVLGSNGFMNLLLQQLGLPTLDIYSKGGLYWVYLYFQWPLMTVLMLPAFSAIQKDWIEAARGLGANLGRFWLSVGLPVLLPSLLGSFALLFANAFGAYATVYALTQGSRNLLPIQIGFQISGDVGYNPAVASALALMMALVLLLCLAFYRATKRWAARLEGA